MYDKIATIHNQQIVNTDAIKEIQQHGSPVIQAIMVRLDSLQAGQARMEKSLDDHMRTNK